MNDESSEGTELPQAQHPSPGESEGEPHPGDPREQSREHALLLSWADLPQHPKWSVSGGTLGGHAHQCLRKWTQRWSGRDSGRLICEHDRTQGLTGGVYCWVCWGCQLAEKSPRHCFRTLDRLLRPRWTSESPAGQNTRVNRGGRAGKKEGVAGDSVRQGPESVHVRNDPESEDLLPATQGVASCIVAIRITSPLSTASHIHEIQLKRQAFCNPPSKLVTLAPAGVAHLVEATSCN